MKKTNISVIAASALVILLSACGPKTETVKTEDAQNVAKADSSAKDYTVSVDETTLEWKATELGGGGHNGKIKLGSGTLHVEANQLTAGKFDIDMNSIQVDDITNPSKNAKLVSHLKNDDFFSVDKHPTASFEITAVEKGNADSSSVKGNLTIKGITKNIAIPAKITIDEASTNVSANFSIDRTQWDIKYRSGKFFPQIGDEAINDAIEFKLTLKATK